MPKRLATYVTDTTNANDAARIVIDDVEHVTLICDVSDKSVM